MYALSDIGVEMISFQCIWRDEVNSKTLCLFNSTAVSILHTVEFGSLKDACLDIFLTGREKMSRPLVPAVCLDCGLK